MSGRGSLLSRQVTAAAADERQQALRALLMKPLLTAAGEPALLALVRRHAPYLAEWFSHYAGWHLHVEPEVARLNKTPAGVDSTHAALDKHGEPFTRRRYVLLCLALASLERAGRQTTLRRLAEDIQGQLAADPELTACEMTLNAERREDRADLVSVGRFLVELQVIWRVHGDEDSYLSADGDCLYAVRRSVLARLLASRVGPSQIRAAEGEGRLWELQRELEPEGEDARNRGIRHRIVRQLLERPVLYDDALDAQAREYLVSQRPHLLPALARATGLIPEIRAEGIALVDRERDLTDYPLPTEGTDGHAALLLAAWLVDRLRRSPKEPAAMAEIEALISRHAADNPRWRQDARTPDGAHLLAKRLVKVFISLDLVARHGDVIVPLPALARFGLADDAGEPSTERDQHPLLLEAR